MQWLCCGCMWSCLALGGPWLWSYLLGTVHLFLGLPNSCCATQATPVLSMQALTNAVAGHGTDVRLCDGPPDLSFGCQPFKHN